LVSANQKTVELFYLLQRAFKMGYETKIVRQSLPSGTYYPALMGGVPSPMVDGIHKIPLSSPDEPGDWRFREMHIMPAMQYSTSPGALTSTVLPYECLVIWEKYKEEE
jgi:hypothetical protein